VYQKKVSANQPYTGKRLNSTKYTTGVTSRDAVLFYKARLAPGQIHRCTWDRGWPVLSKPADKHSCRLVKPDNDRDAGGEQQGPGSSNHRGPRAGHARGYRADLSRPPSRTGSPCPPWTGPGRCQSCRCRSCRCRACRSCTARQWHAHVRKHGTWVLSGCGGARSSKLTKQVLVQRNSFLSKSSWQIARAHMLQARTPAQRCVPLHLQAHD